MKSTAQIHSSRTNALNSKVAFVQGGSRGPVDTDMNPEQGEFASTLKGFMAIDRYGRAEEIASFVAYLAGPEAAYVTGASLMIDGGFSA